MINLRHREGYLPRSRICHSPVCSENIINDQNIALSPAVRDSFAFNDSADMIQNIRWNFRSVAEMRFQTRPVCPFFVLEPTGMKTVRLIEPNHFSCFGMNDSSRSYEADA